jgi:D-alanine-D-alanine ligase
MFQPDQLAKRRIRQIPERSKAQLEILFLAKHARSGGALDAEDGTHALYHHEMLTTLRQIGLNITTADRYEALFAKPEADFVIPLLNRGGFQNSEMLAPLLLGRHELPYLGASPILRGLSDDKHLMKHIAARLGVPTMAWAAYRIGSDAPQTPPFAAARYVVKPNASSASWGVKLCDDWRSAQDHVAALHAQKHDVIVEAWAPNIDVAVPVVGGIGPIMLPAMAYLPEGDRLLRSYEEKRGLVDVADDPLVPLNDAALCRTLEAHSRSLMSELWPFDYGRFEFRVDPVRGTVQFMEVNLSCNLWSKKTISRAAALVGIAHRALVESIVAHSLDRQGLLEEAAATRVAVSSAPRASALVLAGQREGRVDALAAAHYVSHKCLVPVAGQPLIEHVVAALAASAQIGKILISIEDASALASLSSLAALQRAGRLDFVKAQPNIAESVAVAAGGAVDMPLLITTADNVLLTPAIIAEFARGAAASDVAVALSSRDAVLAAHPEGQRRFYAFSEDAYSNCNLYWLGNPASLQAIEIFRTGGQFVKHPGRILNALGIINLICFLFGLGTLASAFGRISRRLGLRVEAVIISDGAAAIDVDNARSHGVAHTILNARADAVRRVA